MQSKKSLNGAILGWGRGNAPTRHHRIANKKPSARNRLPLLELLTRGCIIDPQTILLAIAMAPGYLPEVGSASLLLKTLTRIPSRFANS